MKRRNLTIVLLLMFIALTVVAKDIKRPESYNYTRGVEAVNNNNVQEAMEYLGKETDDNPKNGYAWFYIALVHKSNEEYGQALTAICSAIKYIPKKDKEYYAMSYSLRGDINSALDNDDDAMNDYTQAIDIRPDYPDFYSDRAELFYREGKYDASDADYKKMSELDAGSGMPYAGMGRNNNSRKKYDEAIKNFEYAIKLEKDYSAAYAQRAESYIGLKKYNEAIDDAISALGIEMNTDAMTALYTLADSSFTPLATKLKVQCLKESSKSQWPYFLGNIYEGAEDNANAVAWYKKALAIEPNGVFADRISLCQYNRGFYDDALDYINKAIEIDSTDESYLLTRADIESEMGNKESALSDINEYIKQKPDDAIGYFYRGCLKHLMKKWDEAIEDQTTAFTMSPDAHFAVMSRGRVYILKGDTLSANKDFKTVLGIDTVSTEDRLSAQYAYLFLGQKDSALVLLNKMLKTKENSNNDYNAACVYSILGDKTNALAYLRKSFEKGYRHFLHMDSDEDLNNIRKTSEYDAMYKEYKDIYELEKEKEYQGNEKDSDYEEKTVDIPFTKEGDLLKVKCQINGLPLHFIFDTGASDVSISTIEATFMFKNDYLSQKDIIGKATYQVANGELIEGTVINIRNVNVGGLVLENIKASVSKSQSAPLLLGQSVLRKLGKVEIDYNKRVIKITYKEKKMTKEA